MLTEGSYEAWIAGWSAGAIRAAAAAGVIAEVKPEAGPVAAMPPGGGKQLPGRYLAPEYDSEHGAIRRGSGRQGRMEDWGPMGTILIADFRLANPRQRIRGTLGSHPTSNGHRRMASSERTSIPRTSQYGR